MATMSNKVCFIVTNKMDSATVTANTETAGLPATNVQNNLIRKLYVSSDDTDEYLLFTSAAPVSINGVFIGLHNFTSAATVKWQGNATDDWGSPSLDLTLTVATDSLGNVIPKLAHFWATAQEYQYFRLFMSDSSNPDSFLSVGRVFAGSYVQPTRNMRDGFSVEENDPSVGSSVAGRQGYWTLKNHYSTITYDITDVNESQMDQLRAVYESCGMNKGFVMSIDPAARPHHNSYYVQFQTPVKRTHRVLRQFGLDGVVFEEKI